MTIVAPSSLTGAVIGAAGGSVQVASRTLLVNQMVRGRVTEAFGFSPQDAQRLGITPVVVLFVIALAL